MTLKTVYGVLWLLWIVSFLGIELTALWTGHYQYTLSEWVWKLERLGRAWTFARYFVAAFLLWLFFHLVFGWWR
jgi:hypothetical protein